MSVSTVVGRGYGTFSGEKFVPTGGYLSGIAPLSKPGRLEYTVQRSLVQCTIPDRETRFTIPRSLLQDSVPKS